MRRPLILRAYIIAVLAAAGALVAHAALTGAFGLPQDRGGFWNTFGILLATGLVAEAVALQVRDGATTAAVSFVAYLAAIILLGPVWALVIAGVTELFAEMVIRRKQLIRVVHNTAKEIVAVAAAGYLYVYAGGTPSFEFFEGYFNAPAYLGAALTYFILTNGLTATAVSLSTDRELTETWGQMVGKGLVENVLSSFIAALLAYLYIPLEFFGLLLVLVPLFFVRLAYQNSYRLEQANRELLELMVKSIEARDSYTSGHSLRVATYAKTLARALGLGAKEIEQIETAALLHDVGKIYEEYAVVLRKKGKLTEDERLLMRTHPVRSAELVGTISGLKGYVEQCVRAHHESYDGGGYPDGLAGTEIPIGARIIMVADTADAMMTDRPYRVALSYERVIDEFERCSGVQFDPEIVRTFKHSTAIRRLIEGRQPGLLAAESGAPTLQSIAGSHQPTSATRPSRARGPQTGAVRS
jgi:putative nucleotidyltransferase with HDIG domain